MIFQKPVEEIEWSDIEEFCCQGISENSNLDYKEEFPNHLENTIAAIANTLGGAIIIGVEENDENKPITPIKGIDFQRGLSTRVQSIILSNITPPLFPEIKVCKNEIGDKAVILIRISQSNQTPHAIMKNTRVYLRTGDQNNPEELASVDEISWLSDKRKKSKELKEHITELADNRWKTYMNWAREFLSGEDVNLEIPENGLLRIEICPTFPKIEYRSPSELSDIRDRIMVRDYYGTFNYFPPKNNSNINKSPFVQDGVAFVNTSFSDKRIFFTEINSYGLLYYKQVISRNGEFLIGDEIISRIDQFIDTSMKFFNEIGYYGMIDLEARLQNILNLRLYFEWYKHLIGDSPIGISPDLEGKARFQGLVKNLGSNKEQIIYDFSRKLFWTFGLDFTEDRKLAFQKHVKR